HWHIAPRQQPRRKLIMTDTTHREYTPQLMIPPNSYGDGKTLAAVIKKTGGTMRVSRIRRGEEGVMVPLPDARLRDGDRLRVNDTPENLKEYEKVLGAVLYSGEVPVDAEHPLRARDEQVAEIVVYQGSALAGSTLNETRFSDRYQLVTLALHRAGKNPITLQTSLGNVRLKTGDVLLVQGTQDQIARLKEGGELLVLDGSTDLPHTRKAPQALMIMTGIVAVAGFGILPIAISAIGGVLLMIGTGCLSWRNATRPLSAQVILIIVASLALGKAMLHTGAADYVAQQFLAAMSWATPQQLLSGLILLMAALTNVVSNNAAAVIGTPIAVGIAQQAGLTAEPFVLAVLFGSNMSYATPMAYQTNLLVMNAGGYTFADFLRVGIPLTIILWLAFSWLLPLLYPI
ncbi:MAG: SLC13 family permease, partial [bacterium]|nr:SLC13 family permease [bacterium]